MHDPDLTRSLGADAECPPPGLFCSRRLLKYTSCCALPRRCLARGIRLLGLRVRGAQLLDTELGEPLAHIDGRLEGLALHDAGYEASGECVAVDVSERILDVIGGTYPAPLVSLMSSWPMACTGYSVASPSTTEMVGSVPCVKMTVRLFLLFFLGSLTISFAISLISFEEISCDSAYAAASVSFAIKIST
jgi:hypothetical protein